MNGRVKADPSLIRQRRCAAEHPFGTIKRMTAGGRLLTRGLKKVAGEAALSVLPYNIIRAIHLAGAETLRARLASPKARLWRKQKRGPGNPEPLTFHTACRRRPSVRC
jgi:hypothetical protein